MKKLFLDIETLPVAPEQEDIVRQQYEKIPERNIAFEEFLRKTSLNGNFGRIFCIGYAIDEAPAEIFVGKEQEILRNFWQLAEGADLFVGHAVMDFDLPFIIKRSIIHRIKPSKTLSFAKYRSEPIFDTKKEWDNWTNVSASSLDTLAKIFGYETSKQGIDGSQVYDFWRAGRHQEIYDYCKRDVELTRKIYRRLTFNEEAHA